MPVFSHPEFDGHEQVVFFAEPAVGLKAIVAIHNTARGPALGGVGDDVDGGPDGEGDGGGHERPGQPARPRASSWRAPGSADAELAR